MGRWYRLVVAAMIALGVTPFAVAQSQDPFEIGPDANIMCDSGTGTWRMFQEWRTPALVADDGSAKPLREQPDPRNPKKEEDRPVIKPTATPDPPADWTKPEFNDESWPRTRGPYGREPGPLETLWSRGGPAELGLVALRGKFDVKNVEACRDCRVQVRYYGGVVVYINGQELKRQHMPPGPITSDTLADKYPKEAYVNITQARMDEARMRELLVLIPAKYLKKGVNAVAIELHRAPINEMVHQDKAPLWTHAIIHRAMVRSAFGMSKKEDVSRFDEPEVVVKRREAHVLDNETGYWRVAHRWKTPEIVTDSGAVRTLLARPAPGRPTTRPATQFVTPAAREDWIKPAFDDTDWALVRGRFGSVWGYRDIWRVGNAASLQVVYARGRFEVTDPAACKDLEVLLDYHGGAVVYLNGQELKRADLPDGPLTPDTLATPYPKQAYFRPDGHLLHCLFDTRDYADYVRTNHVRTLTAPVPVSALKKGGNVIAIEIHRSPVLEAFLAGKYQKVNEYGAPGPWAHAAVESVILRSTGETTDPGLASTIKPKGTSRAWNVPVARRLYPDDFGEPNIPLQPIRIVGVRNGAFCGQAVIENGEPMLEFKAAVTDLKSADGGAIPASAIELTYPLGSRLDVSARAAAANDPSRPGPNPLFAWLNAREFYTLSPDPPAFVEPHPKTGVALQPVWLKVRIPKDAKPGDYTGTVTARWKIGVPGINLKDDQPITVPVSLKVHDWTLPDPYNYRTFMDLIESPETVAIRYKVPLWSDEHFRYMEKSLRLLAEVGNKTVYVRMIARTHLGNAETWIRFIKQADGSWKRNYDVFDRYFDLVEKTQGKPTVVVLYAWERYVGAMNLKPLVTELDPASGKTKELETPFYGTPEGKAFWAPVYQELRERLAKRGLEKTMMIGLSGDYAEAARPQKDGRVSGAAFFKELTGLPWVSQGHGAYGRIGDNPTGYLTTVWNAAWPIDPRERRTYGWRRPDLYCQFPRDICFNRDLMAYRVSPEANLTGGQRGMGRLGGDIWEVCTPAEKAEAVRVDSRHAAGLALVNRFGAYGDWSQLVVRTCFIAPGKDGAISTSIFENLREGVQDCETRIFIESALLDPAQKAKLGNPDDPQGLATRAQDLLDERTWTVAHANAHDEWFYLSGFTGRQDRFYALAAEVAKALGAK